MYVIYWLRLMCVSARKWQENAVPRPDNKKNLARSIPMRPEYPRNSNCKRFLFRSFINMKEIFASVDSSRINYFGASAFRYFIIIFWEFHCISWPFASVLEPTCRNMNMISWLVLMFSFYSRDRSSEIWFMMEHIWQQFEQIYLNSIIRQQKS